MSKTADKLKGGLRRQRDQNAIAKQLKIAKQHQVDSKYIQQPHRMLKHHVLNCGNSMCVLCANPRKTLGERSVQEKRLFQDLDHERRKHHNGTDQSDQ